MALKQPGVRRNDVAGDGVAQRVGLYILRPSKPDLPRGYEVVGVIGLRQAAEDWMKFLVLWKRRSGSLWGTKNGFVLELRMRCPSTELKKKVLSFMAGPPNEPPNWLRTKLLFSKPLALSSG